MKTIVLRIFFVLLLVAIFSSFILFAWEMLTWRSDYDSERWLAVTDCLDMGYINHFQTYNPKTGFYDFYCENSDDFVFLRSVDIMGDVGKLVKRQEMIYLVIGILLVPFLILHIEKANHYKNIAEAFDLCLEADDRYPFDEEMFKDAIKKINRSFKLISKYWGTFWD